MRDEKTKRDSNRKRKQEEKSKDQEGGMFERVLLNK